MISGDPLSDSSPYTLAAAYLWHCDYADVNWLRHTDIFERVDSIKAKKLRYWREDFYKFVGHIFEPVEIEPLTSNLTRFLSLQKVFDARGKEKQLRVTGAIVNDTLRQLRAWCQADVSEMPAWLGTVEDEDRPAARHVLGFRNGLLDLQKWVDDPDAPAASAPSDEWFRPSTHDWFSTLAVPRAFDPRSKCPRTIEFFQQTLQTQDQVDLLQEWFGYCLSRDTRWQKMLWMHGLGGGGKGTICRLMSDLVGEPSTVTFGLSDLTGRFTLSAWIGKSVAICREAQLGKGPDAYKIVDALLGISGEDNRFIDRKNKDALTNLKLNTRIMVATNRFPRLPAAGNAMRRRSLILSFDKTFADRPDPHLYDKLFPELPGLTAWALLGLRRLYANQNFTVTERGDELMEQLSSEESDLSRFVDECCIIEPIVFDAGKTPKPREGTLKPQAFAAWNVWREKNGVKKTLDFSVFSRDLYHAFPDVRPGRPNPQVGAGEKRSHMFAGITLKPAALAALPTDVQQIKDEDRDEWSGV